MHQVFAQRPPHEMLVCDGVARRQCQKAYHGSCLSPALNAATLVGRFEGPCYMPGMWAQLVASVAASAAAAAAAAEAAAAAAAAVAAAAAPTPPLPLTTRPAAPQRRWQVPNALLTGSAAPAQVSRLCPSRALLNSAPPAAAGRSHSRRQQLRGLTRPT